MSAIKCDTAIENFTQETSVVLRNLMGGLSQTVGAAVNALNGAGEAKKRCYEVRDNVLNMINTAKERLISVENLLLSEGDDNKRWQSEKEKLGAFIKTADKATEILNGACAYIDKAYEEAIDMRNVFVATSEGFGRESAYGLNRLQKAAEAVKAYGALPKIGENL